LVLLCRSTIRDKIIPHAVSWFTGEAVQGDEFEDIGDDDEEDDENDEDDEDEDDDDDEEDDDEEEEGKSRKQVHLSSRFSLILYYFSS
jgi:nucleosome assembly protein 1-like 1